MTFHDFVTWLSLVSGGVNVSLATIYYFKRKILMVYIEALPVLRGGLKLLINDNNRLREALRIVVDTSHTYGCEHCAEMGTIAAKALAGPGVE